MSELYSKKNHDYGDAFGQTFAELGVISAVTRISDKTNRLKSLATKDQRVNDEKIEDTLMDLANYAVMTLIELKDNDDTQPIETVIAYADGGPVFKTERRGESIAGQYLENVYPYHDDLLKQLQSDGYDYLARDESGELWTHSYHPTKQGNKWRSISYVKRIYNDNFPEVKWAYDEPTEIAELLEAYENGGENGKEVLSYEN